MLILKEKTFLEKNISLIGWAAITSLLFLTFWMHQHFFFSQDTSWLLEIAHRLLKGGNYSTDFIEVNPPLIAYIHILPILLSRLLHLSLFESTLVFAFILIIISLLLTHLLLKKIFPRYFIIRFGMLLSCLLNYTVLSGDEFFQRECITIMLTFPYILLTMLRLKKQSLSFFKTLLIGSLAAIGFCLKPQFFMAFFLINAFLMIKRRSWMAAFQLENIIIIFLTLLYAWLIYLLTPNYLFQTLPWVWTTYYSSLPITWFANITKWYSLLIYSILIIYCLTRHYLFQKDLATLLLLTALGFWLAFIMQKAEWYYHAISSMMLALNLLTLIFTDLLTHHHDLKKPLATASVGLSWSFAYIILCSMFAVQSWFPYDNPIWTTTIQVVKAQAKNKMVGQLSFRAIPLFPLTIFTETHSSMRLMRCWTLAPIVSPSSSWDANKKKREREKLQKIIAEDLSKYQPDVMIVDTLLYTTDKQLIPFDYPRFFSENPSFKKLWGHYHYLTRGRDFKLYVRS